MKATNCLSEASFCGRLRQLLERGKPKAKFLGGLSFVTFLCPQKKSKIPSGKTYKL